MREKSETINSRIDLATSQGGGGLWTPMLGTSQSEQTLYLSCVSSIKGTLSAKYLMEGTVCSALIGRNNTAPTTMSTLILSAIFTPIHHTHPTCFIRRL